MIKFPPTLSYLILYIFIDALISRAYKRNDQNESIDSDIVS